MKHSPFAGAASFAHLIGLRPKGKKAEDEDTKPDNKKVEEDTDKEASENEDEEEKAEDEDKDPDASEDDEEEKAEDDEGKKAKGKSSVQKAYSAGRADERNRCASIFAAPSAAVRPDLAAHLAFNTGLSAKDAVGLLATAAGPDEGKSGKEAGGKRALSDRMARERTPDVGADGGNEPDKDSVQGVVARMKAVYERATGAK